MDRATVPVHLLLERPGKACETGQLVYGVSIDLNQLSQRGTKQKSQHTWTKAEIPLDGLCNRCSGCFPMSARDMVEEMKGEVELKLEAGTGNQSAQ